ncbi:MAG: DUF3179 domain-containing (seleno)protein [Alphaproteobacteria bacterium]
MAHSIARACLLALALIAWLSPVSADLALWKSEFPLTDFSRAVVPLAEIEDDGNFRDTIVSIDAPRFQPVSALTAMGPLEPVLSIGIDGDFRAYPLRMLLWHEIVNDVVGGVPVLVTYCPLCNSGVVYNRRLNGEVLSFGNTGRIRHAVMVMYDHALESWWQQFTGEVIVGAQAGAMLRALPARLESLTRFRARAPRGWVMIPADVMQQPYGETPYFGTDALWDTQSPNLVHERYPSDLPDTVSPLTRVVVVGDRAWSLDHLRTFGRVETDGLILTWQPGQNSIHDSAWIPAGRDVGNIVVQKIAADGTLRDVVYDVTFVFAFRNFRPDGEITF